MTELGMKITLATGPFGAEPLVLFWLALMIALIVSAPIHLFFALKRRWGRRRKPSVSDLLK